MAEDREDRLARCEVCALVAFHALVVRGSLDDRLSTPDIVIAQSIALGGKMAAALESANETFEP